MLTEQRAHHLAKASEDFQLFLGPITANDLLDWVSHELGHPAALDDYQQVADILTKATPPKHLLHIISGNTPHAGLQSLLRGLLIGAQNTIKMPTPAVNAESIPEITAFYRALPRELQGYCHFTNDLSDSLLASADCVIAIGSDPSINLVHKRLTPKQRFIPHGHKISFALIDQPSIKNAQLAAVDISLHNQQGCLSPHAIYVQQGAAEFAPLLATAMAKYAQQDPRGELSLSESGAISNLRETIRYQSAQEPNNYQLYESPGSTCWTVIYKNSPVLRPSPQNRTIYVQPWPDNPLELGKELEYLSSIALSPLPNLLNSVKQLNPSRICQLGKLQYPHLFWHHDGFAPISSLITWQDIHL